MEKVRQGPIDIGAPGPTTRDMVTGFRSIRADPLAYLSSAHRRYGDVVAFPVPGPPALLISGPVDIRRVLQTAARNWSKETLQYHALGRVTGPGLLASSEPNWIDHRRLAAPAFHHSRLEVIGLQVAEATDTVLTRSAPDTRDGCIVDVADLTLRIALDVVGRALFSADLSDRAQQLLETTSAAARLVVRLGRSVLPSRWPTTLHRRLAEARRTLDALCLELVASRRAASAPGEDLLGLLIDGGLKDQEIRDELVTMIIAGHETVAASLAWTLMLLAEDQPAQDRLRDEVAAHDGPVPMVRTAARLPWTRAVIDESLRLYPPAWVISRRCRQADLIGGRDVPAGTTAIISPWVLHRRADYWPAVHEFAPQRFVDDQAARTDHYLPFGAGPRLCIGREFALGEMSVVLSRLLARYRVTVPPGWSRPKARADVAIHPHGGMPLQLTLMKGQP